jgi:L-alanine-DL-glutamate epimerase-like enolase superfamily enzyme
MRITRLRTRCIETRPPGAPRNALTTWTTKTCLLVGLETDAGLTGIGESWCEGASPEPLRRILEDDLAPLLVGEDPRLVGRLWSRMMRASLVAARGGATHAAVSGVDIALWDLLGQVANLPLYRMLGGSADAVPACASGGLYAAGKTPEALGEEVAGWAARGFRLGKVKVGGVPLEEDVARIAAARAAAPELRLAVDAVYCLDRAGAARLARALAPMSVEFLEAPLPPDDLEGMARLDATGPLPIAGCEFAYGVPAFRALLDAAAVSIVNLDAILCGGISEAMRICALAGARHRNCSFHVASSAVAFAANLHVAAAVPNVHSVEWHTVHRALFDRLDPDLFMMRDGLAVLPQGPGLGLDGAALLEGITAAA